MLSFLVFKITVPERSVCPVGLTVKLNVLCTFFGKPLDTEICGLCIYIHHVIGRQMTSQIGEYLQTDPTVY
jgi:hypothetical protein